MDSLLLAVNGGLMSAMRSHQVMLDAGASLLRADTTAPCYRLWSVDDRFPAMVRDEDEGTAIALEVWTISPVGFVEVLQREPVGLSVGKVELANGNRVFGVIGEPSLCKGRKEITNFGGWRAYKESLAA
jgi:hypothetical protein